MATPPPSTGIDFVYSEAKKALDDQLAWIDALDTKAGLVLAGDGLIAGIVLAKDSLLAEAPLLIGLAALLLFMASFLLALGSFATKRYEVAPDVDDLLPLMPQPDEVLKQEALPSILQAFDINEPKLDVKARLLSYSGASLILAVLVLASYFVYFLLTK